jgi:hypothetical protein
MTRIEQGRQNRPVLYHEPDDSGRSTVGAGMRIQERAPISSISQMGTQNNTSAPVSSIDISPWSTVRDKVDENTPKLTVDIVKKSRCHRLVKSVLRRIGDCLAKDISRGKGKKYTLVQQ